MSRSHFKGPFISPTIFFNQKNYLKLFSKHSMILPEYVDRIVNVYNGKIFVRLRITEPMIGRRFGEFVYTRASYRFKKKK
jgi:small subunit ribosomal protein S19